MAEGDRHDLPCWTCGGTSCTSLFVEPEPHLNCFKCGEQNWNQDEVKEYLSMDSQLIQLVNSKKEERVASAFPYKGIMNALDHRKINKATAEKYGVLSLFKEGNESPYAFAFPAFNMNNEFVAQKIKRLDKKMKWSGRPSGSKMFGQHLFPAGGKYITITEGEEDCLAAYQMLKERGKGFEPAVISLFNGAGSAEKECKANWEYINSFDNIIVAFDGDAVGQAAAQKVAKLFNYRVKVMLFGEAMKTEDGWINKDANDYLRNGKVTEFVNMWWRAEKVTPKGVLAFSTLWDAMTSKDQSITVPWPWAGMNEMTGGVRTSEFTILKAPPKIGKCFGKDTPVRMFDGSVKFVQDIVADDLLMGDDSTARRVLSTIKGQEEMYAVHQTKRDTYIVNESHILCVKNTDTKEKIDIPLVDYLIKKDRIRWKGYSEGIRRFKRLELYGLSPYILGVWLGDGSSDSPQITSIDKEVIKELYSFADKKGMSITKNEPISYYFKGTGGVNLFTDALRKLGVLNNKRVPSDFILASVEDRLDLLAGFIDTDGHYTGNTYTIIQKNKELAYGIRDVARSLSFRASIKVVKKHCYYKGVKKEGVYYNININGCLGTIPCKVKHKQSTLMVESIKRDPTVCGLVIEKLGIGDYYGFVLDGNHRFLLEDFTVVHNTQILRELAYHIRTTTEYNVGLMFLEDTQKSIGMGMCALHMNKPIQFPNVPCSLEELRESHDFLSEDDRLTIFDPEDERTPENIINKITYFVKARDCKFIILDHISMLAYQNGSGDERRFLDKLVADLKALTISLDISIIAVTHVNDEGNTRGSRAFAQLCDLLLNLARDRQNPDEVIANTTEVIVEENRKMGLSGSACKLYFNRDTGRMKEIDPDLFDADGFDNTEEQQPRTVEFGE